MDLLQTVMNIPRSAGDLLASMASTPQATTGPTPGNPAEGIPGADQQWAQRQYQLAYANAMNEATRQGQSWTAAPNIAQAAGDTAYASALQNSAQIVDVARQAREAAKAREAYPQLLEQSAKELGLTPAQYNTLKVLPADQGIAELKQIATLKYSNRTNPFTAVTAGDGNVVITNTSDGSYQVVNTANGTATKATPHVLPDSTIAMIDKTGHVVAHVDANGNPVTTSGAKPTTGMGAMGTAAGQNLSAQLHSADVNGLFSATDKDGNPIDLLAPPDQTAAVPARALATMRSNFANNHVIKDLNVRSEEHSNIVKNITSPDVGPLDRPQKDVSLLYMYAHMLNPTVSVHDGGLDALKQSVPLLPAGDTRSRFTQMIDRLTTGQSLTPDQRQSILRESAVMAKGTIGMARNYIGQTAAALRAQGIHPGLVVTDPTMGVDFGDESGVSGGASPAASTASDPQARALAILKGRKQ